MGGIFWAIVFKQYPHIATIYKKNAHCVEHHQGKQIKVSPHSSEHTSVH